MKYTYVFAVISIITAHVTVTMHDLEKLAKVAKAFQSSPIFNITVGNHANASAEGKTSQEIITESKAPADDTKIEAPKTPAPSLYESTRIYTTSFFTNHWGKCLAGSAVSMYVLLYALLQTGKHAITQPHTWASWKDHIELSRLSSLDSQELAAELIQDIQECCMYSNDITNTSAAFTLFLSQVAAEEKKLNRYITLARTVQKARLSFAFPVSRQLIEQAQVRVERLRFVRKLFARWNAQHNLRTLLKK